jgi:hypothetical protein
MYNFHFSKPAEEIFNKSLSAGMGRGYSMTQTDTD